MKDHPIFFKGDMVRAILDGSKTQTRRVIKPQPYESNSNPPIFSDIKVGDLSVCPDSLPTSDTVGRVMVECEARGTYHCMGVKAFVEKHCPHGVPGDLLWVKEPFRITQVNVLQNIVHGTYTRDDYPFLCDFSDENMAKYEMWAKPYSGKSSRFMFKSFARLWLRVKSVRVERLREISDEDIVCEGFECRDDFYGAIIRINKAKDPEEYLNKWCWAVEFERTEKEQP